VRVEEVVAAREKVACCVNDHRNHASVICVSRFGDTGLVEYDAFMMHINAREHFCTM